MDQGKFAWVCYVLLGVTGLLYAAGLSNEFKPTPDSCEYVGVAQAVLRGEGFWFNGQASQYHPPVMPLVLAGVIRGVELLGVPEQSVLAMKAAQLVMAIGFTVGGWRLARRYVGAQAGLVVAVLVGANLAVFQHTVLILSDMLYACVSVWALVLLGGGGGKLRRWIGGLCLLEVAWLCRPVGLFLGVGALLWAIAGRSEDVGGKARRMALGAIVVLLGLAPILWLVYHSAGESNYLTWWRGESGQSNLIAGAVAIFAKSGPGVVITAAREVLNVEASGIGVAFGVATFCVLVLGWWLTMRLGRALPEWYMFVYVGAMCLWANTAVRRFYLPMLPLLLIYAVVALRWMREKYRESNRWRLVMQIALYPALGLTAWPLVRYWLEHSSLPGPAMWLRQGYIYSGLAGAALVVAVVRPKAVLDFMLNSRWAKRGGAAVYVALALAYLAGYAALEHGVVKTRGPMLRGWQPYYRMGEWMGKQSSTSDTVLSSQVSIVHLAGGTIIRPPRISEEDTIALLARGKVNAVLVIRQPNLGDDVVDGRNEQLWRIVREHADDFSLIASQEENLHEQYYLYHYEEKGTATKQE